MNRLNFVLQALKSEDEIRLTSLLLWQCSRSKCDPRGINLRFFMSWTKAVAISILRALIATRTPERTAGRQWPAKVYAVLQTQNQLNALMPCLNILSRHGIPIAMNVEGNIDLRGLASTVDVTSASPRRKEHLAVATLLILRLPTLLSACRESRCNPERLLSLATLAYRTMLITIRQIETYRPSLVLMANDHCPSPRATRLASEKAGVKTAYVQHACVSANFPILAFDYAFLDGEIALQCYMDSSRDADSSYLSERAGRCTKYLVGQQKQTAKSLSRAKATVPYCESPKARVGMAVSIPLHRDAFGRLYRLLLDLSYPLLIRTHPRQPRPDIAWLQELCKGHAIARVAPASEMDLADYLSQIDCLIAGNSSIHLEAAVAGRKTYYCPLETSDPATQGDYYGFLKNGVSTEIPRNVSMRDLDQMLKAMPCNNIRPKGVQRYSETYNTPFAGKENEVLASIISDIIDSDCNIALNESLAWKPHRKHSNTYRPALT